MPVITYDTDGTPLVDGVRPQYKIGTMRHDDAGEVWAELVPQNDAAKVLAEIVTETESVQ